MFFSKVASRKELPMSSKDSATPNKSVVCVNAAVEGYAEPDIAEFSIRFQWHGKSQEECARQYAEDVKRTQEALKPFELENELKVSGYSSYANRSRHGRTITGYEYSARGVLRLKMQERDVSAIWTALAKSAIRGTINVYFSLDDEDAEEAKLIGRAVAKARSCAEALAVAAGKQLGDVRQIRYKRDNDGFIAAAGCLKMCAPSGAKNDGLPALDPEPVEVECSVDVDWWLE